MRNKGLNFIYDQEKLVEITKGYNLERCFMKCGYDMVLVSERKGISIVISHTLSEKRKGERHLYTCIITWEKF